MFPVLFWRKRKSRETSLAFLFWRESRETPLGFMSWRKSRETPLGATPLGVLFSRKSRETHLNALLWREPGGSFRKMCLVLLVASCLFGVPMAVQERPSPPKGVVLGPRFQGSFWDRSWKPCSVVFGSFPLPSRMQKLR